MIEDPHEVLHVYEGDGGVIIRENGNVSTFGEQSPEVRAAFAAATASIPAGLDAVDMDMIQRGDRLGPELGARVASALLSLSARVGELDRELRETDCPRPCNHQPDALSVGQCVDAGECGCRHGAPLIAAEAKLAAGDHDEGLRSRIEAEWVDYERSHIAGDNPRGLPFVYFMRGYERGLSAPRLRPGAEAKLAGGEVTEAMVQRALASLAKEIEMTVPMRSPMYRALETALRGEAS